MSSFVTKNKHELPKLIDVNLVLVKIPKSSSKNALGHMIYSFIMCHTSCQFVDFKDEIYYEAITIAMK